MQFTRQCIQVVLGLVLITGFLQKNFIGMLCIQEVDSIDHESRGVLSIGITVGGLFLIDGK